MFTLLLLYYYIIFFMDSNNLEGRQGSDLIQYSAPWEYELTNKQKLGGWSGLADRSNYTSQELYIL